MEAWRYLPFPCYLCGRNRLEYNAETGEVACEKCGADAEVLELAVGRAKNPIEMGIDTE